MATSETDERVEERDDGRGQRRNERSWTFLTNHAHVLLAIAKRPDLRLSDIATLVGITERTAMQIVTDLEDAGYIRRLKRGRRNHYVIQPDHPLRHPLEEHHRVDSLLGALEHEAPDRL